MSAALWLLLGAVVLVILVVLEGRRQERIYGRGSGRSSLARAGLLELQSHLEPERRVEILLEERDETEQDDAGEGNARRRRSLEDPPTNPAIPEKAADEPGDPRTAADQPGDLPKGG